MSELTQEQQNKILKLASFADNKELAIFDELQQMNDTLKVIADKEIPPFPELKEPDFTETSALLQKLLDKEGEVVEITLEIV